MRFKDRVILITGAASGIGKATSLAFAKEGASVVAFDIDGVELSKTADEIRSICDATAGATGRCVPFEGDVGKANDAQAAIKKCLQEFGRLDFLFNNAGLELVLPLMETDESTWDAIIDTNLKGTYLMSYEAVKVMSPAKFGVIINNASDAGLRGIKYSAAYSTSKAGIIHFTRSLALDYAKQGIRSNCICPGCIRTPLCERFNAEVGARKGKSGEEVLNEFVMANIPMERVGTPEEVSSVVTFLCSDDARYINGAIIPIDGGLTAGM